MLKEKEMLKQSLRCGSNRWNEMKTAHRDVNDSAWLLRYVAIFQRFIASTLPAGPARGALRTRSRTALVIIRPRRISASSTGNDLSYGHRIRNIDP